MDDKEFRKLRREDLIEIIYQYQRREQRLTQENEMLKAQLEDRRIRIEKAGSIAEAALSLSGIFEAAQKAADLYMQGLKDLKEDRQPVREQPVQQSAAEPLPYEMPMKAQMPKMDRQKEMPRDVRPEPQEAEPKKPQMPFGKKKPQEPEPRAAAAEGVPEKPRAKKPQQEAAKPRMQQEAARPLMQQPKPQQQAKKPVAAPQPAAEDPFKAALQKRGSQETPSFDFTDLGFGGKPQNPAPKQPPRKAPAAQEPRIPAKKPQQNPQPQAPEGDTDEFIASLKEFLDM